MIRMHEVGIIQETLNLALAQAVKSGARQIHRIRMRVGAMSGVVPEALEFAFEVVRQGTMAAGARLEVDRVPASCWCAGCQIEFESPDLLFECPQCRQMGSELRKGREIELASMEIS